VLASALEVANVVVDIGEDTRRDEARDDGGDYCWNCDDDDEVLDVDDITEKNDDEDTYKVVSDYDNFIKECNLATHSRQPTNNQVFVSSSSQQ
jgi:hypothetical protein